jgi:multidrug efflux system membrane fusion protein
VGPDDKVRVQPIEVADTVGGKAVIVKGLEAGDRVVTDGQYRLTPGARIVEKQSKAQVATVDGSQS